LMLTTLDLKTCQTTMKHHPMRRYEPESHLAMVKVNKYPKA
jgi:hypothetical protein